MQIETILIYLTIIVMCAGVFFAIVVASSNYYCVKAKGPSMEPLIPSGSNLTFERTQDVNVGDVIEYYDQNRNVNVIHKLIAIQNGLLITKGINWPTIDAPFERKFVLGKWTGEFTNDCQAIY